MATINSDGKNAYVYNASDDTWYSIGGAVNTNQQYTWSSDQTFTAATTFENVIKAKGGINNFQNATARDAVLTSPVAGVVCFVRQENDGSVIDQVQYYSGSEWRYVNDSATFVTILVKIACASSCPKGLIWASGRRVQRRPLIFSVSALDTRAVCALSLIIVLNSSISSLPALCTLGSGFFVIA